MKRRGGPSFGGDSLMAEQGQFSFKVWISKSGEQIYIAVGICNRSIPLYLLHGTYTFEYQECEGYAYCKADNGEGGLFEAKLYLQLGSLIVEFVDSDIIILLPLRDDPDAWNVPLTQHHLDKGYSYRHRNKIGII